MFISTKMWNGHNPRLSETKVIGIREGSEFTGVGIHEGRNPQATPPREGSKSTGIINIGHAYFADRVF